MSMHLSFLKNALLSIFINFRLWETNKNSNRILKFFFFGVTKKMMFILHGELFRTLFCHSCEEFKSINGKEPILTSFWSMASYRSRILGICLKIRIPRVRLHYLYNT